MDLLSICIPTYNRKERLEGLLKKLCEWNDNKIKIIVIDNASTDGTEQMMKIFNKFSNVLYLRNSENLGHDGNYLRIIEESKKYSKYSLWLGDDDCVTKEFFKDIPNLLKVYNPDLLVLNSISYTNNKIKRCLKKILKYNNTILNIEEDLIERNYKKFFEVYTSKLPFGTIIIKTENIDINKIVKYKGTYHLYSGAIWEMLNDVNNIKGKINVYITAKPYIIWGKGSKSYSTILPDVCLGIGKYYAILPQNLFFEAKKEVENIIKQDFFGNNSKYIKESYLKWLN